MTTIRSDMASASSWSWVTKIVVMPTSRWMILSSVRISSRRLASSADSGSSSSSTSGSMTMARASAMRCCWPPESSRGQLLLDAGQPHHVERALHLARDLGLADVAVFEAEGDVVEHVLCGNSA